MQASNIPLKLPIPFANNAGAGYIRSIPVSSQIGITDGAASLHDGFPPLNFLPEAAGGIPPFGQDMNGILYEISSWAQWESAGGPIAYDGTFSAAIGGYPKGAMLMSAAGLSWWISTVDNNTSNPDAGGANWILFQPGQVYAGNPNGFVAGIQGAAAGSFPSMVWDITHKILWVCTTTGNAAAAVWTQISGGGPAPYWCGTSTGSGNAQVVTTPLTMQAFAAGTSVSFIAGFTNTGAAALTVGLFGTFPIRKSSPTGPLALAGGEIVAGNIVTLHFDGVDVQLDATALGTAALANASSGTGTVAAVTSAGSIVPGNLAVFTDDQGTVEDSGASIGSLNSSANNALYQLGYLL